MIQNITMKLIFLFISVIAATNNHFVRTDTSAPELEVKQREYVNPKGVNKIPVTNDLQNKEKDEIIEVNDHDEDPPQDVTYASEETIQSKLTILNFDDDHNTIKEKIDDVISVSSYNIPEMPKKIGPEGEPIVKLSFKGVGPKGIDDTDKPNCNAFSRTARFNPYSVLNVRWFNFYRWDSMNAPLIVEFFIPTSWEINFIRKKLDTQVVRPISWNSRLAIMHDLMYNTSCLLVERSDHGQYWMYPIMQNYTRMVDPIDVRFKQSGGDRFLTFVICDDDRAFVFSRINEIPRKKDIPDAVATVGWRGRDGRTYLYQGHKWMPIEELTEEEYWTPLKYAKKESIPSPPEPYDPEADTVKIFNV